MHKKNGEGGQTMNDSSGEYDCSDKKTQRNNSAHQFQNIVEGLGDRFSQW